MHQNHIQSLPLRRLEELESRLTFQELTIEELNQIIIQHQVAILKVEDQLRALTHKLLSNDTTIIASLSEEMLPPHY